MRVPLCPPSKFDFDTEEEYQDALDAYETAVIISEDECVERDCERRYNH